MTTIESNSIQVNKPASVVYGFLADLNNHQQLMPDSIYNWSSTEDECKFTIQNMAKLELKVGERVADTSINIVPKGEVPFPLNLKWEITANGDSSTAKMIINADLNPFIKMMAMSPLQKLANFQAEKLKEILSAS
jgi:carbon monoxide dehydrogenase subunit G